MENEEKFIKEFLQKMASQNNRGTASPYFYVIRDKKTLLAPLENSDDKFWYIQESDREFTTIDAALDYAKREEIDLREIKEYGKQTIWVEHGMFLTEDDAENHLKVNHYHYSDEAYTYVKCSWRSPNLKRFLKCLFSHFGIEKGNLDL